MRQDIHGRIKRTAELIATISGVRADVTVMAQYPVAFRTERILPALEGTADERCLLVGRAPSRRRRLICSMAPDLGRIPVSLLTAFLGRGTTTLLNRLFAGYSRHRQRVRWNWH